MLPAIFVYSSLGALMFVIKELVTTVLRNYLAHQFFKKNCPGLPIIPNKGIFGGHINEITWVKRSWKVLGDYHMELGKTIGLYYCEKPGVSTLDMDLIKVMVLDKPDDHLDRFKPNTPLEEMENECILTCETEQWRRLRVAIAPAFRKSKIMSAVVQKDISCVIERLIDSIEHRLNLAKLEKSEKFIKLDVDDMFLRYSNALVFTCFYKQDSAIDFKSDKDYYTDIIEDVAKNSINPLFRFCVMFPNFLPIMNLLMQWFHPLGKMRRQIMSFIRKQTLINLQARQQVNKARENFKASKDQDSFDKDDFYLKSGEKFRRNMIDYVIDQFHDGKITKTEYLNNAFFVLLAASKTSGDGISKLLYCLAANPDEQDKLRACILAEGTDSEYLHWAICEALRLFPPAPFGCSRTLSHDVTTKDGHTLPAGVLVHIPVTVLHRWPEYWGDDADEFKPERWRHADKFHRAQYMPFGLGKRKCPGMDFALSEIKMLFCELMQRYRFKCSPETNEKTIMNFGTYLVFTCQDSPTYLEFYRL